MGNVFEKKLAALLPLMLLCAITFADLSVSGISVLPDTVRPGASGVVSMTVTNTDTDEIYSINAIASGTGDVRSDSITSLGGLKYGASNVLAAPFSVREDADAGIYSLNVRLTWTQGNGSRYKNVQVPISVINPAIFSIQSINKTVYTTGDFEIDMLIENGGGIAKSSRVSINSTQFLQTGQNPLMLGNIGTGDKLNFKMGLTLAPAVTSGTYSVPVAITYVDEAGEERNTEAKFRIDVKKKSARIALSIGDEIRFVPGHDFMMPVIISNGGDEWAYDVQAGVASPSAINAISGATDLSAYDNILTALGSTYGSVGDLSPGEAKQIILHVGVNDIKPGFYKQYFVIKGKDANGDSKADELFPVGLNVEGLSDVSVFVSANPAPIMAGGEHTLSVLISNVGTSPIKALIVSAKGDDFVLQEAQDEQFIGGLVEDDFSTVQYKVKVANVPSGTYPLNVTMKFKDSYNRDLEKSQVVYLKIKNLNDAQMGEAGIMAVVILLVLLIAVVGGGYWYCVLNKKGLPKIKGLAGEKGAKPEKEKAR
ncbi:hypothetical protein COU37_04160 [Candidatus Micrarchaeota archaeon CG10_big_fil_rev_8_21_14_0_10_45_29]|nr:MAG: hypothetical protein COU37_04160 [Candidatus Micrarchaeota archaeon CG10_big_fil_rev_8_21_14_0_10_45_29]